MSQVLTEVVVEALCELADEELQRRLWTAAQGPEVGSFVEAASRLLDDSGLGDALDGGTEVFGEPADGTLIELAERLMRIDGIREPALVLADPQMEEVRRLAATALNQVGASQDPKE